MKRKVGQFSLSPLKPLSRETINSRSLLTTSLTSPSPSIYQALEQGSDDSLQGAAKLG
ncbi:hypothetical protein RchiOBHm_Chr5g0017451 [Rosa chinensis]|uniref:Uncharacterized protein n=1 Tax=Rosa chinensis TaxID=74649 RepID=A0A2P6Q6G4_ROSCH|nr:hypothetical protein RchiOBHm_Chr5g0017451 [Rosa chinensis]